MDPPARTALPYSEIYYAGLPSNPRLLAGTHTRSQFWWDGAGLPEWKGPGVQPVKQFYPLQWPFVASLWNESIVPEIKFILDQHCPRDDKVCIDIVSIGFEGEVGIPIVWLGVPEGCLTYEKAEAVVEACEACLAKHRSSGVPVEIRETDIAPSGGPALLDPTLPTELSSLLTGPFTAATGIPITVDGSSVGTAGVFLAGAGPNTGSVYLLTAQHVISNSMDLTRGVNAMQAYPEVRMHLAQTWLADFDENVKAVKVAQDMQLLMLERRARRLGSDDVAAAFARARAQTGTELSEIAAQIEADWDPAPNRILGRVFCHPPVNTKPESPSYKRDWALITVHPHKLPQHTRNALASFDIRERMSSKLPSETGGLPDCFLPISGILSQDALESSGRVVLKRGAATGLTIGHLSGLDSHVRRDAIWTRQLAITCTSNLPFSAKGDSGATIIDPMGQAVGILTDGCRSSGGDSYNMRANNDITYATPLWWVLEDIRAFGDDVRLL